MTTLLLLEDESAIMRLMRNVLKQYSLIEAATGEQALLRFIDHDHRIDLLIADVNLPRISGIQVALLLRTKLPRLPIVLTSGYPLNGWRSRDAADLERLGAASVAVLQKPFTAQILRGAVGKLIGTPQMESARTA